MMKKIFTRQSVEGASETDSCTAKYEPKISIEEYTSSKNVEDSPPHPQTCPPHLQTRRGVPHLHLQTNLHTTIISPNNVPPDESVKVTNENSFQHKSGDSENGHSVCPWIKSSTDSYATNIYCQLLPVLAANIGSLSSGLALGYSAVLLPQIRQDDPDVSKFYQNSEIGDQQYSNSPTAYYRPFTVSMEEGSWIAGIFGLGAILGGLLSAFLGNRYGRKMSLILLAIPDLLGWILVASSQNLGMMLAGRFLAGFAAAGYSPNIQIYVGEITQPQHRGWLAGLTVPIMAIGVLTMYVVGSWLPWHFAAASCTPAPLLMVTCLMFYWDSPYWYMHAGMEKSAHDALEQFRGSDVNIDQEMFQIFYYIKNEAQQISFSNGLTMIFTEKKYFKPFLILNILFLLMLFSGKFAIDFYAVEIFHHFGGSMNDYLSATIAAFIHLIGSLLFIPLVKRFSRKMLLILSSFVMGVSLLLLGLCMYSHSYHSMPVLSELDWLPMICIVTYMVAAPIGLCSIPFIYIAEFFPSELRSLMGGLTITISSLELFIVVKTFPNLEELMGGHGVFWLYAFACFCAIIFTLSYIPETKDKDLTKVEDKFAKLRKVIRASPWVTPLPSPSVSSVRKLHFKTHLFTQ